jgi:ABC-2 type transport system permease protein
LVFAAAGIALIGSLSGGNRFGLDGTATWVLISSSTDARDPRRDLAGGDLAATAFAVPVLLVLAGVLAAISDGWRYLPPTLGLGLALYGIGLGLSDLLAVYAPFAVPPSQNAFGGGGAGQGCTAGLLTIGAMLAEGLICLPLIALLVVDLGTDTPVLGWVLLVAGPGYGWLVGAAFRRAAAARWATHGPEILQVIGQK